MNNLDKMLAGIPSYLSDEAKARVEKAMIKELEDDMKAKGYTGPSFMTFRLRSKKYKEQLAKIAQQYAEMQNECPHINSTYLAQGNSGGWDNDDEYWYEWRCGDCGKYWTTPQSVNPREVYPYAVDAKK